jgi:antitoxin (DNA-binding transcriptional repressor) of toxin-antitoxin stability system
VYAYFEEAFMPDVTTVNTREFRQDLARYLESDEPIAITRHGRTIGYYIPAQATRDQHELDALKKGAERLQGLLETSGIREEDVIADFDAARKAARKVRG